jgi:hypothetical protein
VKLGRHRRRDIGWDLDTCQDVPVQQHGNAKYVQMGGKSYVGKGRSIPRGRGFVYVCDFRGKPAVMLANGTALRLKRSKLK